MSTGKPLIIVESPTKARTIERAFGRSYRVAASLGHLRDLPRSQLGVAKERGFEPKYITVRGRGAVVQRLKALAAKARATYLAADPDREGEAISWHLAQLLSLDPRSPCRIVFHEITKEAVAEALRNPRPVDMNLVDAQQARRVLDRLVGYELSPLLWRKVRRGLSAGRVQSVAVRLCCEREREIQTFVPDEYWTVTAVLSDGSGRPGFKARFLGRVTDGGGVERVRIADEAQALAIVEQSRGAPWTVASVKQGMRRRNPPPPFTTSTLQQEASHRLGFGVRRTMAVAQQLYEGVELGALGPVGLITYMRTDATRVAETARQQLREFLGRVLPREYLPAEPPKHRPGRRAQEAHEAIRPTDPARVPGEVRPYLSDDQFRLYRLIWERFFASEMAAAVYRTVSAEFNAGPWVYRASGSTLDFEGFLAAFRLAGEDNGAGGEPEEPLASGGEEGQRDEVEAAAPESEAPAEENLVPPDLVQGQVLALTEIKPERHFTSPPPRYSEATLVRAMEELGIGRPSTYAPTIETILTRGYVEKEEGRLKPTRLGEVVTQLLLEHFPDVIDVAFTAEMENQLDQVEEGLLPWREVVRRFYEPFAAALKKAEAELGRVEVPSEETGFTCEVCGRPMVVKYGRYGRFLACSGYPECRHTRPYAKPTGLVCPKCGAEVVEKRTKKGRRFYGCQRYPECDFSTWSRPTERTCPECGSFMVVVGRSARAGASPEDGEPAPGRRLRCANEACGHEEYESPVGPAPGSEPSPGLEPSPGQPASPRASSSPGPPASGAQ